MEEGAGIVKKVPLSMPDWGSAEALFMADSKMADSKASSEMPKTLRSIARK